MEEEVLCLTNVTPAELSCALPRHDGAKWEPLTGLPGAISSGQAVRLPSYGVAWFAAA